MPISNRRVVTGLNKEGKSCVIFEGPPLQTVDPETVGTSLAFLWQTESSPASNAGNDDAAANPFTYQLQRGGSALILVKIPGRAAFAHLSEEQRRALMTDELPSEFRVSTESKRPGMHATPTVDYIIMMEGQVTLILEDGEVELKAGDILIDRGVVHAWENRGEADALMATVMIDAG